MNRINKKAEEYLSSIKKIEYKKKYVIIESNNKDYIYYDTEYDKDIYDYLKSIGFNKYYKRINNQRDDYSLFLFEKTNNSEIELLGELYQKSKEEIFFEDKLKRKIYDRMNNTIRELNNYYYGLQDSIEEMLYPRKDYYDLLISISLFHRLIRIGNYYLNKWFNSTSTYFEVLNLNDLDDDNFLGGKIVSFAKAKRDFSVFEIANYYQKYYNEKTIMTDIDYLFEKTSEKDSNRYLFYSLITNMGLIEDKDITERISYVKRSYNLLLKEYEEDENNKYDMFNEKEKNI